jgi:hypothetical protein
MSVGSSPSVLPIDKELVLRELQRVLESASFRQSKRCASLLRHIVELTLAERWDHLRERSVGVELFGRSADYGTAEDAVVRVAAVEVRKRLAHYYDNHGTVEGLRIDVPPGAYIAEFRQKIETAIVAPQEASAEETAPAEPRRWPYAAALATLVLVLAGAVYVARPTPFAQFWSPILDSRASVLVGLGLVDGVHSGVGMGEFRSRGMEACKTPAGCDEFLSRVKPIARGTVPAGDVIGLAQVMRLLGAAGKPFRVRGVSDINYSDVKEGDAILIAYFSNPWTVEAFRSTRFRLRNDGGHRVYDETAPGDARWKIPGGWPTLKNEEDFAIIARIRDEKTGRTQIIAGGFTPFGTEAAATVVADEAWMNEALSGFPSGWEHKNLQIVLRTRVKAMIPGPPEVLARHAW